MKTSLLDEIISFTFWLALLTCCKSMSSCSWIFVFYFDKCPQLSTLAFQLLLCVFPSQYVSLNSLTCPFPSSLHLFLIPLLVSLFVPSWSAFSCIATLQSAPESPRVSCFGMFLILVSCLFFDLNFAFVCTLIKLFSCYFVFWIFDFLLLYPGLLSFCINFIFVY